MESETDLRVACPAFSWSLDRSYNSTVSGETALGNRWQSRVRDMRLRYNNFDANTGIGDFSLISNSNSSIKFSVVASTQTLTAQADSTLQAKVVLDTTTNRYQVHITDRVSDAYWVFWTWDAPTKALRGRLAEETTRSWKAANKTGITYSYNSSNLIDKITIPTQTSQVYGVFFSYTTTSMIASVEVRAGANSSDTLLEKVEYTYVTSTPSAMGEVGDLIQVKVSRRASNDSAGATSIVRYTQYRYYPTSYSASSATLLKAVYKHDAIDRIVKAMGGSTTPDTLLTTADTTSAGSQAIKNYASRSFEYFTSNEPSTVTTAFQSNEDLAARYGGSDFDDSSPAMVKKEVIGGACDSCGGSSNEATVIKEYHYLNLNTPGSTGVNSVVKRLVIEDTKGSSSIDGVYRTIYGLNDGARVLRQAIVSNSTTSSPTCWCESWIFDTSTDNGQRYLQSEHRLPSAHNVATDVNLRKFLNPSSGTNDSDTLLSSDGVIELFRYNAKGMRTSTLVKKGSGGTPYMVSATDYGDGDGDGVGDDATELYLMTASYDYPDQTTEANRANGKKTTYTYTFYDAADRVMKTRTQSSPAIPTTQNGSNVVTSSVEYFDTFGRVRWTLDGEGYVEYRSYDPRKGGLAFTIKDVEPSSPGSEATSGSSGNWDAWTVGGADSNKPTRGATFTALALVSKNYFDDLGRPIRRIDVNGKTHVTAYGNVQIISFPFWNGTTTLVPIQVVVQDDGVDVSETYQVRAGLTAFSTDTGGFPTGFSSAPSLSDYVSWTRNAYDSVTGRLQSTDRYHTIPNSGTGTLTTNFHRSSKVYDGLGRTQYEIQVVSVASSSSAREQVTKYDYDIRNRVIAVYKGVSDESHNVDTSLSSLSVDKVEERTYDKGGVGDGYVTQVRRFYGTGANSSTGEDYFRTFRGHVRGIRPFDRTTGSDVAQAPFTVNDVDWMGRTIATADFTADLSTSDWNGLVNYMTYAASTAANRGSLIETVYDDLNRIYQSKQHKVNLSDGSLQGALVTDSYYDRRGLKVATGTQNGSYTETAYDSIGRMYQTRTVLSLAGTLWSSGAFQYRSPAPNPTLTSMSAGNGNVIAFNHQEYSGDLLIGTHQFEMNHDDTTSVGIDLSGNDFVRRTMYQWYDSASRLTTVADYGSGDTASGAGDWKKTSLPSRGSEPSVSTNTMLVIKYGYNTSTGRLEVTTDPKGMKSKTFFDALDRRTFAVENWDGTLADPDGANAAGNDVNRITKFLYNGLSIVKEIVARNAGSGNDQSTKYLFEDGSFADRITNEIYPDSTDTDSSGTDQVTKVYNLDGTLSVQTDQRRTKLLMTYDGRRRLKLVDVDLGTGNSTDGSILSIQRDYDGLGRMITVTSYSATGGSSGSGSISNQVVLAYDGLGNVTSNKQSHEGVVGSGTPTVQYAFDATAASSIFTNNHRLQSVTYPNGRVVFYDYGTDNQLNDRLSRIQSIRNANGSGTIWTTYSYNSEGRLAIASYPQINVSLDYLQGTSGTYGGYDRFGRIKDQRWLNTSTSTDLDRYQYGYDDADNRLWRKNPLATVFDRDWLYAYDTSHRLDVARLGQLNTGRTGLTTTFAIQDWSLDALGNWSNFQQTVLGTIDLTQSRGHNKANEVGTVTNTVGAAWAATSHDAAGNMKGMPKSDNETVGLACVYDAWNRLVKVARVSDSTTVAEYEYDGLNRRIVKSLGTGAVKEHYYYNEDWQELEVRKETNGNIVTNPLEQFVWHPYYIDALATRFWDASTSGSQIQHYFTHDANFNVTGAVNASALVVERYDYSPYGEPIVYQPSFDFDADGQSDIASTRLYTGQRMDTESGLHQYRNRYYHARLGRFVSRDPIEYEGSKWNLYEYAGSAPLIAVDPTGELDRTVGYPNPITGPSTGLFGRCLCRANQFAAAFATGYSIGEGINQCFNYPAGQIAVGAYEWWNEKELKRLQEPIPECTTCVKTKEKEEENSCAKKHSDTAKCSSFAYRSLREAVEAGKRRFGQNRVTHTKDVPANRCKGGTTSIYGVRNNARLFSVTCCPCCEDTPAGPTLRKGCDMH